MSSRHASNRPSKHHGASKLLPFVLGASLVAASFATGATAAEQIRCEIHVTERANAVALEAVVHATAPTEGTYEFHISGSGAAGGSDIDQAGEFSVKPGESNSIGSVTLASDGSSFVAHLTVTAGGSTSRCTKRVVGTL